jgi:hypothetical protein
MPGNVTLPDQNAVLGRCSRCGAEIRMEPAWYERLANLVRQLNALIP